MAITITLTPGTSPVDQIRDQIRGHIEAGRLGVGTRLPSVRQLAADLGIAPGTVAKAYKALESDGVLATRKGGGTRVGQTSGATPQSVVAGAEVLVRASHREGVDLDEAIRVLRAIWMDEHDSRDDDATGSIPQSD